jgi:hypothetical protein
VVVLINLQSFWIKRLAQELRCGHVVPIFHDPGRMMELRSLVSGYKNLVLEIVRTKNRYKALFRSEAIKTPGVGVYRSDERINDCLGMVRRSIMRVIAKRLANPLFRLISRRLYPKLS